MLDLLVKLFEERKIFRRKRKDWKIKALAILIYFAGLSYRKRLEYKYERFGERNAIEGWYSLFKARVKRFWKRFPFHSTLESVKGWSMAWINLYNLEALT